MLKRIYISESLTAVTALVQDHARLQPSFSVMVYDDMCHLDAMWKKRLDPAEPVCRTGWVGVG